MCNDQDGADAVMDHVGFRRFRLARDLAYANRPEDQGDTPTRLGKPAALQVNLDTRHWRQIHRILSKGFQKHSALQSWLISKFGAP